MIEKKPAYHYQPGSKLLSIGSVGCNWSCDFCINSPISQSHKIVGEKLSPEQVIELAESLECDGVAYTYNEPLVSLEFARDTGLLAHKEGLFNVVVTNGYGTPEAMNVLSTFADCVTVGVKGNASNIFLRRHSGISNADPMFSTLQDLKRSKIHVEISNLIIGQGGDSLKDANSLCRWITAELGSDTPIHFIPFFFAPSLDLSSFYSTSVEILKAHCKTAMDAGLTYVYVANFPGHELENTYCPKCKIIVIERFGYEVRSWNLDDHNRCLSCGYSIPIVGRLTQTPLEERYAPVIFPPMDLQFVCEGLTAFPSKSE
jgi:pyruvate formate lyase activating enzyme